MAIDEAILNAHLQGYAPPTLRIYRWNPIALSIGYFQDFEKTVDSKKCSGLGIDVVRRLTGGRAVFHRNELTYSIVVSDIYGFPKSLIDSYRILCEGLIAAYRILGLEVDLVQGESGLSSPVCFTSASSADLTFRGRKIAGSAQFRKGNAILQHGSLPISRDTELFFSILKFPSDVLRAKTLAAFEQKTTSLSEILGSQIYWQRLKEALFEGFQQALNIHLYRDALTRWEIDTSEKLTREKYSCLVWNYCGNRKELMPNAIT
jgi:lipoate-protein ligase A